MYIIDMISIIYFLNIVVIISIGVLQHSFSDSDSPGVRRRAIFLTFILKCNETQGKVDPGVIILYNIPEDSPQKSNFGC